MLSSSERETEKERERERDGERAKETIEWNITEADKVLWQVLYGCPRNWF